MKQEMTIQTKSYVISVVAAVEKRRMYKMDDCVAESNAAV